MDPAALIPPGAFDAAAPADVDVDDDDDDALVVAALSAAVFGTDDMVRKLAILRTLLTFEFLATRETIVDGNGCNICFRVLQYPMPMLLLMLRMAL